MAGFPPDEAIPLDGTVGSLADVEETAPFGRASVPVVSVTGDGVADPAAMGLAEDLGVLVQAFIRRPSEVQEKGRSRPPAPPDPDDDIQIALHGLDLDPDAEAELHGHIRKLVRDRLAPKEAEK